MLLSNIAKLCSVLISVQDSFSVNSVAQSRERVLYAFTYPPNCDIPAAPLVADAAGNLYGTTTNGGDHNVGCVFELSLTANGWQESTIYSFSGADGDGPASALVFDKQ